jgi:maltodextrin utilization protein YvdJ
MRCPAAVRAISTLPSSATLASWRSRGGRTGNAIRTMQLEAEIRANPELRADRFVQSWQQLQAQRGRLTGSSNREARQQVEGQMRAMAKGLEKDPALGNALTKRGDQLIGKQWSRNGRRASVAMTSPKRPGPGRSPSN